jgi:hypothetical protein
MPDHKYRSLAANKQQTIWSPYAKFFSRSHHAVIRVFDEPGNVIVTHEHADDFKEWVSFYSHHVALPAKPE